MSMRAVAHRLARREPQFAVPGFGFRELAVWVARMVRHTFVRRLGDRAGGDHQKRERNTHRSTHWHCIDSPFAGHPLVAGNSGPAAMPIVLGWTRECRSVSSRIVPDKPGSTGRTMRG